MTDLDEGAVDMDLRAAWDGALIVASEKPATLHERVEALDFELTRVETGLRLAYLVGGRAGFSASGIRRVVALRALLDMACFFERHAKDKVLGERIRQLKERENGPMDSGRN